MIYQQPTYKTPSNSFLIDDKVQSYLKKKRQIPNRTYSTGF